MLNHAGNPVAASALADEARSMDLADRYLNSECVMAMLEADQVCFMTYHLFKNLIKCSFY